MNSQCSIECFFQNHNIHKICVINDPLGQTFSPSSSYNYFQGKFVLLCDILKNGDGYTGGNMCEDNDHYRQGLWVGRVD